MERIEVDRREEPTEIGEGRLTGAGELWRHHVQHKYTEAWSSRSLQ